MFLLKKSSYSKWIHPPVKRCNSTLDLFHCSHILLNYPAHLRLNIGPGTFCENASIRYWLRVFVFNRYRSLAMMESILQNLRYELRALLKSPRFTSIALITLVLGIAANVTIFTLWMPC
jgi:hypothetical protein